MKNNRVGEFCSSPRSRPQPGKFSSQQPNTSRDEFKKKTTQLSFNSCGLISKTTGIALLQSTSSPPASWESDDSFSLQQRKKAGGTFQLSTWHHLFWSTAYELKGLSDYLWLSLKTSGWWLNQPIWNYARSSNWIMKPQGSGPENNPNVWNHEIKSHGEKKRRNRPADSDDTETLVHDMTKLVPLLNEHEIFRTGASEVVKMCTFNHLQTHPTHMFSSSILHWKAMVHFSCPSSILQPFQYFFSITSSP